MDRDVRATLTITSGGIRFARPTAGADWSGVKLTDALARKITGAVETCGAQGTRLTVTFPIQPPLFATPAEA